jgi:hypothetical protein
LNKVVRWASEVRDLHNIWDKSMFKQAKDQTTLALVDSAISRQTFWVEVDFMKNLTNHFDEFMSWAQGCPCHDIERISRKPVECPMQGLRFPELHSKVESLVKVFQQGAVDVDPNLPFALGAISAYRESVAIVRLNFDFLSRLPYSLARARDRSVAQAVLQEYDAAPDGVRHHRVTEESMYQGWGASSQAHCF